MSLKSRAAFNEEKEIKFIVESINKKTVPGLKIIESFSKKFGLDILEARERVGSSRGVHYDFSINVAGIGWKNVEHKGSKTFKPINSDDVPWKAGVQFYNGGCEKYSVASCYAKLCYEIHIASGSLANKWNITAPIPTFDEFWKDCCLQADPKSSFQKELKAVVRSKQSSLLDERRPVVEKLVLDESILNKFKQEVSDIANDVLEQKDYWLTIHGNVEADFYVEWYPKYTITNITSVEVKRGLDIKFTFICEGGLSFHGILRWGKGAGFSCLRIDLK
jgi:hypothetical protein